MNKVALIGNIGNDIPLKYKNDKPYCFFTLAVKRRFQTSDGVDTDWLNCTAFGKTAEFIHKYFFKGSKIALAGHIQVSKKKDEEGNYKTNTSIIVDEVEFVEKKKDADEVAVDFEDGVDINGLFD